LAEFAAWVERRLSIQNFQSEEGTFVFLLGTHKINAAGHLEIGGCDAVELADQFGTPLYVMDEAHIRVTMRAMRAAFEKQGVACNVIYASKAFTCLAMARIAAQEGLWIDVASAGELYTALRADFPAERIVFHGNNKSREELEMAVKARIGRVIVDNERELALLDEVARENGVVQAIMLRLTPAVDPHTHHLIQTGRADTKFGMNIVGGLARRGVERALEMPHLKLVGLSSHIGSQILEADFFRLAARLMCEFLAELKADLKLELPELDLGGGLGIRYLPEHTPPSVEEYAATLVDEVRECCQRLDLTLPQLYVEPGRSLVGEAGTTLYRAGGTKAIPEKRTYVAVDGGMSDNPRPALYEARYHVINASKANEEADATVTISGKHCETDTLVPDVSLKAPETGDVLAVFSTGAYNQSMASNYNRFRRPAVVLVHEGEADIIVERETLQDLISHDLVPGRLRS
jgi:diaminopimelate decarboxylase